MKMGTFRYALKQGWKNIGRNKMFSIASVITMAACIFLFGIFYSAAANFKSAVKNVESDVAVTVFFDEGLSQEKINEIGQKIAKRPEVSHYKYVSAEEAWNNYRKEYFKGNEEAARNFEKDNPLKNSANYQIYMKDLSRQNTLVKYLQGLDGVREVHRSETAANTLTDFNRLVSWITWAIILILIGITIFLISNTVRTGITVRREEIGIMKIIGASSFFVRAPFIVEGILIGLIGSVIPLVILYGLYDRILGYLAGRFQLLYHMMNILPASRIFGVLIPVGLLLGVGIGYLGSRITVHRHLRDV